MPEPLTIIKDDADKVPPPPPGRHPHTAISYADDPRRGWPRMPAQAWIILSVAALAPILGVMVALWRGFDSLFLRYTWLADAMLVGLLVVFLIVIAGVAYGIYGWASAKALHARIVRTRLGNPADVRQVLEMNPLAFETLHVQMEIAKAPYSLHPYLSTGTGSSKSEKPAEALALPDTALDVSPVSPSTWLSWMDEVPHILFAGRTKGGKTTLALHMLKPRADRGESFTIIDPHSGDWGGLPVIGGGENWYEIENAMERLIMLYQERLQERRRYKEETGRELPHDYFPRLTIIFDEAWLARKQLDVKERGKKEESIWQRFIPVMGSGARKVGMSLWPMTQTANVDDLGISRPGLENFKRIPLDLRACRLFATEEPSIPRRAALLQALSGMEWPAMTEHEGQVVFLSRQGMEQLPDLRRSIDQMWTPGETVRLCKPSPREIVLKALRAAREKGLTRDQARGLGLHFDNNDWSEAEKAA